MDGRLIIQGARQNNLKNISLEIPHDQVTVITGISGSGKSSLAFETIFAEGQWRYIESLSTYARMFLEKMDRPDVDAIINVRPAIAIEQKNPVRTARSTVGTATELYDYLRLLFAKVGLTMCPKCQQEVRGYSPSEAAEELVRRFPGERAYVLFPHPVPPKAALREWARMLLQKGFVRLKVGEEVVELDPEAAPALGRRKTVDVVVDRLVLRPEDQSRLADSLDTAFREGGAKAAVEVVGQGLRYFGQEFCCYQCGQRFEKPQPLLFSFNHPLGACPECRGFGNILEYDEDLIVPNKALSLAQGAIEVWNSPGHRWWYEQLEIVAPKHRIDLEKPYAQLTEREKKLLFDGTGEFEGINGFFEEMERRKYKLHVRVLLSRYRSPFPCPACKEAKLKPEALAVQVGGRDICQLSRLTVEELARFFEELQLAPFEAGVAEEILRQIRAKLGFLLRVGLGYLTLDRQTRTLSGGEAQRISLANQLGSQLVGTLYVLDEPSIGLHARDIHRLAAIVRDLASVGNTVVVVEHDRAMIEAGDYLVELGPASGERGGEVVFAGPREAFLRHEQSLTVRYLLGQERIPVPLARRPGNGQTLMLTGARENNLKGITLRVPLGTLTCVTGVSGSGKSTLVYDTLYKALARLFRVEFTRMGRFDRLYGADRLRGVRLIDQEPIGRTPRSNPVTYIKAFDEIRKEFAALREARHRGLTASHFSFNVPGGRCEACGGGGYQKLEMYFFEDMYVTCEECGGRRYKPEVLEV
ncbi:MAG: excinuclease ABC subunit UvrA, partial [Deltaproteobacteria bacterium]|nr:excinuclease ABC subunit UvrA [Deltaproteobacteria bacterium]